MNDESDHGKNTNSTARIFDLIQQEEMLADHLLSPDSSTVKKRNAKKFFEDVAYLSLLQAVRMYTELLRFLEKKRSDQLEAKTQPKNDGLEWEEFEKLMLKVEGNEKNMRLNEEQIVNLKVTQLKYKQAVVFLNTKIVDMRQQIAVQQNEIKQLNAEAMQCLHELIKTFQAHMQRHIADPDFKSVVIMLGADKNSQLKITIDKNSYLQLMQAISISMQQPNLQIKDIQQLIQQNITALLTNKLTELSKNLLPEKRADFIAGHKDAATNELSQAVWRDISQNHFLVTHFEKGFLTEKSLLQARLKLTLCEHTMENLMTLRTVAETQMAQINDLLKGQRETSISSAPPPHEVNRVIAELDMRVEQIFTATNNSSVVFNNEMVTIMSTANSIDDLFGDLGMIKSQANAMLIGTENSVASQEKIFQDLHVIATKAETILPLQQQTNEQKNIHQKTSENSEPEPTPTLRA